MIDFEHVTKQYKHGEKPALEDINFHVDDGEFVFLLGHSGAGKSTLLKLILRGGAGLPAARVLVDGKDVAKLRRHKIPTCAARWALFSGFPAHPHDDRLREHRVCDACHQHRP